MAMRPPSLSRRELVRLGALLATGSLCLGGPRRAFASGGPRRFVQINLEGGWDSAFATDPVIGSKERSGAYDPAYLSPELAPRQVAGKPSLVVGPGLAPGQGAFARIPTAFVNGVFMEVSSHDFAYQYMSSGRLSLSNTRDFPSIAATLGATSPRFPPHVVVGMPAPLGDTRLTSPPLHGVTVEALDEMVGGPSAAPLGPGPMADHFGPDLVADAHALIEALDAARFAGLPPGYQSDLAIWRDSSRQIEEIYARELGGTLSPSVDDEIRYGDPAPGTLSATPERLMASVYRLLKSDLCPYITVSFGSFDTHSDELAVHLPLMQRFARALDVLVQDLASTPDPSAPSSTLAETTTLFITSEFVRTPVFTPYTGGTEHWQSASAILMGRGVRDGAVVGATATDASAAGWDPGRQQPGPDQLLPDHLIATILASVGGTDEQADAVSLVRIEGLFDT